MPDSVRRVYEVLRENSKTVLGLTSSAFVHNASRERLAPYLLTAPSFMVSPRLSWARIRVYLPP